MAATHAMAKQDSRTAEKRDTDGHWQKGAWEKLVSTPVLRKQAGLDEATDPCTSETASPDPAMRDGELQIMSRPQGCASMNDVSSDSWRYLFAICSLGPGSRAISWKNGCSLKNGWMRRQDLSRGGGKSSRVPPAPKTRKRNASGRNKTSARAESNRHRETRRPGIGNVAEQANNAPCEGLGAGLACPTCLFR